MSIFAYISSLVILFKKIDFFARLRACHFPANSSDLILVPLFAHFKMGQPTSRENSVYVTELTLTILKWKHVIASTPKFQLIDGRDSSDPGPFSEIFWLPVTSRGVKSFKGFLAFAYPKLVNRPLLDCTGRFVKYIFI